MSKGPDQAPSSRLFKDTRARDVKDSSKRTVGSRSVEAIFPCDQENIGTPSNLLSSLYQPENLFEDQTQSRSKKSTTETTFDPTGSSLSGNSNTQLPPTKPSQSSGMVTPLDMHNIMMSIDEDHSVCPQRLTQDLLNVLHTQFPIVKDCEEVDFTDSAFQDPMVSMAGIATQAGVFMIRVIKVRRRVISLGYHPSFCHQKMQAFSGNGRLRRLRKL